MLSNQSNTGLHRRGSHPAHSSVSFSDNSGDSVESLQSTWYSQGLTDSTAALHLSLRPLLPSHATHSPPARRSDASVLHVFLWLAQTASVEQRRGLGQDPAQKKLYAGQSRLLWDQRLLTRPSQRNTRHTSVPQNKKSSEMLTPLCSNTQRRIYLHGGALQDPSQDLFTSA